jgi:DNA-binding GntR family transcriptional regulator
MTRIRVQTLAQEIAKRIREMIRNGNLERGERLLEKSLCQAMGVSRTPLREALRVLSSEGLIELIPNKGARVAQPSLEEIRDMFWIMSILEGRCARECAERMDEGSIRKLDNLFRRLKKYSEEINHEKYMAVNHRYHSLVQELAGSKVLSSVIDGLRQKILLFRYRQIYLPHRLETSMQEHSDLHQAFRNKDPEEAERRMREHLVSQWEALERVYSEACEAPRPVV